MYYPCSKNKGADQLHGYHKADLHLCLRPSILLVFLCSCSINPFVRKQLSDHYHLGKSIFIFWGIKSNSNFHFLFLSNPRIDPDGATCSTASCLFVFVLYLGCHTCLGYNSIFRGKLCTIIIHVPLKQIRH